MSKKPKPQVPTSSPVKLAMDEPKRARSEKEDVGEAPAKEPADDEEQDEGDEAPLVVVATVADLSPWMPPKIARQHGARPVWFLLERDASLVGVFQRYAEGPMDQSVTDGILGGLRAFSTDKNQELQLLLGPTDRLQFGFHVSASLEEVVDTFQDDGFDVLSGLADPAE